MSQSKMSGTENEKKFVIKHRFENVTDMKEGDTMDGPIEKHFNIHWNIRVQRAYGGLDVFLDCMVPTDNEDWSICANISGKFIRKSDEVECENRSITFTKQDSSYYHYLHKWSELPDLLIDGNLSVQLTVIIEKATNVYLFRPLRNFDDELAREDSDVTLIVQNRKFHVSKMLLIVHSSYFKKLFSENFSESGKSEIELKGIDLDHFQHYLHFIYVESFIEDRSVLGILHLADFFLSMSVVRRCHEFLIEKSKLSLKQKFEVAIKYNLEELKNQCVSEMKTASDFRSIVPTNPEDLNNKVWKELLLKSVSLIPN